MIHDGCAGISAGSLLVHAACLPWLLSELIPRAPPRTEIEEKIRHGVPASADWLSVACSEQLCTLRMLKYDEDETAEVREIASCISFFELVPAYRSASTSVLKFSWAKGPTERPLHAP